jgi:hypothetical protein
VHLDDFVEKTREVSRKRRNPEKGSYEENMN